jgi:3-oxocholest-4-en-26-oate---CoA ligase
LTEWNYADVWETVAEVQPDETALIQGKERRTWAEFDQRADGVAHWLGSLGTGRQDKVALYLYNSPEYLETLFGAMKMGLVPVNTNYRYADDELAYLWENADAVAVVFHGAFTERVERVRQRVPGVRAWLWVDDGTDSCPSFATSYEDHTRAPSPRVRAPWGRSGDDLFMLYTGGTTGMPKGVMWRQDDLFARLNSGGFRHYPLDEGLAGVQRTLGDSGPGMSLLPACPLMHGTGGFTSIECLSEGGRLVLLEGRSFDPVELLDAVEAEAVSGLVIVGDSFARPILAALIEQPRRWDLAALMGIVSSGAMWSEEVKRGLLEQLGGVLLVDAFSSSEALGMGTSVSSSSRTAKTADFVLGPEVTVITPEGAPVEPGSDEIGVLALGGRNPLGYYKDEEKSAATFKVIDGVRYSVPGDFAKVRADGSIHLLGRGSVCINTAGEKVFPEEVEEVLKTHPAVRDAVVVGVPHERFGQQVVAAVEVIDDEDPAPSELIDHVKEHLAHYKAPRRVRRVETIGRSPNGKVDYGRHSKEAARWMTEQA